MPDFKIESNIPVPVGYGGTKTHQAVGLTSTDSQPEQSGYKDALAGASPVNQPKRRGRPPGSKNKRKTCHNNDHSGNPCSHCGDKIPCVNECVHYECLQALGKPLPDWYSVRNAAPEEKIY